MENTTEGSTMRVAGGILFTVGILTATAGFAMNTPFGSEDFDYFSPAQKINEGDCHMGQCGWTTTLSLDVIEQRNGNILKKMRFVYGSTPDGDSPQKKRITWNDDITEVFILCSTSLPSVMSEMDGKIQTSVLDFSQIGGADTGAAGLYVEACHGLNHSAYAGEGFMERYGYHAGGLHTLGSDPIEIRKPKEIFEFVAPVPKPGWTVAAKAGSCALDRKVSDRAYISLTKYNRIQQFDLLFVGKDWIMPSEANARGWSISFTGSKTTLQPLTGDLMTNRHGLSAITFKFDARVLGNITDLMDAQRSMTLVRNGKTLMVVDLNLPQDVVKEFNNCVNFFG